VGDETKDGAAIWQTCDALVDAMDQPWHGFGGAWGKVNTIKVPGLPSAPKFPCGDITTCATNVTGPLGPWHKPLLFY
jgi:hypothetical protein